MLANVPWFQLFHFTEGAQDPPLLFSQSKMTDDGSEVAEEFLPRFEKKLGEVSVG
jgi:hypothetical protein